MDVTADGERTGKYILAGEEFTTNSKGEAITQIPFGKYNLTEIDQVFIPEFGYIQKATAYDYLKSNPNTISVGLSPYPYVVPALSKNYEKYVRSASNDSTNDNLLKLPRE